MVTGGGTPRVVEGGGVPGPGTTPWVHTLHRTVHLLSGYVTCTVTCCQATSPAVKDQAVLTRLAVKDQAVLTRLAEVSQRCYFCPREVSQRCYFCPRESESWLFLLFY